MSLLKIKQLQEERNALVTEAQKILNKESGLTTDEEQKFDKLMLDSDKKKEDIERWQKVMSVEAELAERSAIRAGRENISVDELVANEAKGSVAFSSWLKGGMEMLDNDQRKIMLSRAGRDKMPNIQSAQSIGTTTAGGFLVPQGFSDRLDMALKYYAGMKTEAETMVTDSGAAMPWPTVNDTAQVGAILAENATITAQDVTFSSVTFNSFMYTSKLIAVSLQLMQDSFFSIDNLVADLAGQRLGRVLNTHFTVGTGAGQPNGIVTASNLGKLGIVGQTTSVIYDDLVDLVYSVDVAYRPASKFMLNDLTIRSVRKLKDTQNRPLWEPSLQVGQPDRLFGYPLVTNNDVVSMAANAKSIIFGQINKYKIREVRGITLMRLSERYADNLQVGFFAFGRWDGNLIDAGTHPVSYYQNSAT